MINSANSAKKYNCKFCNISCSKKNDWDRHIHTRKHKCKSEMESLEINKSAKKYQCMCGKIYNTNCGLWKHKQKCDYDNDKHETPAYLESIRLFNFS